MLDPALQGQAGMAVTAENMEGRFVRPRQVGAVASMALDARENAGVIDKVVVTGRAVD